MGPVGKNALGELIGGYRLDSVLGAGGMGCVYAGSHQFLSKKAAIKVLAPELAEDREFVSRFFHEARVVSEVRHPNIVEVIDYVAIDEPRRVAYVMEYIAGPTLRRVLGSPGLRTEQALNLALQLLDALEAVHVVKIIHRDLKPENLLLVAPLDSDFSAIPCVKILDFGVAKIGDRAVDHHTATGSMLGTPAYMAPEQIQGAPIVPATDLYAWAEILFEMLTGDRPFKGEPLYLLRRKLQGPPELELPDALPARDPLRALIGECMAAAASERPSHARCRSVVKAALIEAEGRTDLSRRPSTLPPTVDVPSEARTEDLPSPQPPKVAREMNVPEASTQPPPAPLPSEVAPAPPPERSMRMIALGALFLLLSAAVVGVALLDRSERAPPAPQVEAFLVPPGAGVETVARTLEPELAEVDAPPAEDAERSSIELISEPPGSLVRDALTHEILGATPLQIEIESGTSREVSFSLAGHETRTTTVRSHHPKVLINLKKL